MVWLVRLLLLIPSLLAGFFVSQEDPRLWLIALVIALVFLVLTAATAFYVPSLGLWPKRKKPDLPGQDADSAE